MNIIDLVLLAVLFISVIFAVYRGSVASLLGVAACILSLVFSLLAAPRLARVLSGNQGLSSLLATYTDSASLVGDYSLATTQVAGISTSALEAVMKSVRLPDALSGILRSNLSNAVFAGAGLITVNEYVSATIVSVVLQAGSFVFCFLFCFLVLHAAVNLINHVFHFPILKHLEPLASALLGLLRGMAVLYALFLLVPLLRTIIPLDLLDQYLGKSLLSPVFANERLFSFIISGS